MDTTSAMHSLYTANWQVVDMIETECVPLSSSSKNVH